MQVAYVNVYSLVTGNPHPGETSSYIPNEDNALRHTGDISGNTPLYGPYTDASPEMVSFSSSLS